MRDVYINAAGAHLPGEAVGNDRMAAILGEIDDQSQRLGRLILRQNRIEQRHYAMDERGEALDTNAGMAAKAARAAVEASDLDLSQIDYLATGTTQGDLLVPGHASAVHAALGAGNDIGPIEIASFQSVCASSMMAAKSAFMTLKCGEAEAALVTGSEMSSRWFRPGFYRPALDRLENRDTRMAAEFLRWTLSDGAGALVMQSRPRRRGPSFRVDWIRLVSLADRFDVCMHAGIAHEDRHDPVRCWSHHADGPRGAAADGAIMLMQDMGLLKRIIRGWVGEYLALIDRGAIVPSAVDHVLCHYSAHSLREEIIRLMKAAGAMIDEEKWFTNLYSKGNTGSAALFIMLEEFMARGGYRPGEKILCVVPESGRAVISFMMLTVEEA
ncbi:hypothetical protein GCM10011342_07660 [Aquisalinus flavus]|uniref:Uncharacterized protein n=2 Tax=Aquisalinus flavus TaxID=1526572 RepID=A0A8J2V1L9_9PROT|nr:hypothetical protein GCM10011342_07660 [Aquisalinus flavus]